MEVKAISSPVFNKGISLVLLRVIFPSLTNWSKSVFLDLQVWLSYS